MAAVVANQVVDDLITVQTFHRHPKLMFKYLNTLIVDILTAIVYKHSNLTVVSKQEHVHRHFVNTQVWSIPIFVTCMTGECFTMLMSVYILMCFSLLSILLLYLLQCPNPFLTHPIKPLP